MKRNSKLTTEPSSAGSENKRWRVRLAAILVGLLPLLTCELVCQVLGLPRRPPPSDPFVDLEQLKPLFRPTADQLRMEIGPERMNLFNPAGFFRTKAAGTYRIFALGGSTTYGEPYRSETAFPHWLGLYLQAASPEPQLSDGTLSEPTVEVINCGGLSYASYRVLAILREVLNYEPDLIVVYTGHNEYLESRSYAAYQSRPWPSRVASSLGNLRTVQLMRLALGDRTTGAARPDKSRTIMQAEVDALLDYQGGLEAYQRDASWREPVVEHYRWNIEQMSQASRAANVPLVLINPVANLLDCPPIKFEVDPKLTADEQQRFEELWEAARTQPDQVRAMAALTAALEIDPTHAAANFLLGRWHFAEGEIERARERLTIARDQDVCPLRATTAIQTAVVQVANAQRAILVDADELFSGLSAEKIVGNRWLIDHVHPTVEGHQQLGEAIANTLIQNGLFPTAVPDEWLERGQAACRLHLGSLSEPYFQRGQQRLEGLLLWSQGRAKKVRESSVAP